MSLKKPTLTSYVPAVKAEPAQPYSRVCYPVGGSSGSGSPPAGCTTICNPVPAPCEGGATPTGGGGCYVCQPVTLCH